MLRNHTFLDYFLSDRWNRIWAVIHLQWHPNIVNAYLERCEGRKLSVFLTTAGVRQADLKSRKSEWEQFLQCHLHRVGYLNVFIANHRCSDRLARAFEAAANSLETFILDLGDRVRLRSNLFGGLAPLLSSACIRSPVRFDLSRFSGLRELQTTVVPLTQADLVGMLSSLSNIEVLTLTGTSCPPSINVPDFARGPILLPRCRSLTIEKMASPFIISLLKIFILPAITKLSLHEKLFPSGAGFTRPIISETFPFTPSDPVIANSLWITVRPNRIQFDTDGTPSYSYSGDMRSLYGHIVPNTAGQFRGALITMFTTLATKLSIQPTELIIQDKLNHPTCTESPLSLVDLGVLWCEIFSSYPSVQILRLTGDICSAIEALKNAGTLLPILSEIHVKDEALATAAELDVLAALCRSRVPKVKLTIPGV